MVHSTDGGVLVRPLRPGEIGVYLDIHARAVRGLAAGHYPPEVIDAWVVPPTDANVRELARNEDGEIRLIAELAGEPVGIGALVPAESELRACYVVPEAARRGCGSALVREIERMARERGLERLTLAASLNAEAFYAALGYEVRERSEFVLHNGQPMAAVWMTKRL
jgi:putative acetyltransferase